jgi:hypothetical protein
MFSAAAILMLVLSPLLVALGITGFHAIANPRRTNERYRG